jgi:hypothetical protein
MEIGGADDIGAPVTGPFCRNRLDFRYLDKLTSCAGKAQNKTQSQSNGYKDATSDDGKSPMAIVSPKSSGKTKRRKTGLRGQVVYCCQNDRRE